MQWWRGIAFKDATHHLHRCLFPDQRGEALLVVADAFHAAGDEEVLGGSTCQARNSPFRRLMLLGNLLPQASDFASMVVLRSHTNSQHTPFASEITPSCSSNVQCSAV